jgi:hypothetical protein
VLFATRSAAMHRMVVRYYSRKRDGVASLYAWILRSVPFIHRIVPTVRNLHSHFLSTWDWFGVPHIELREVSTTGFFLDARTTGSNEEPGSNVGIDTLG